MSLVHNLLQKISPLDKHAMSEAEALQRSLIKPSGSLGELERISVQLAGITGHSRIASGRKLLLLFGSDHGIYDEGVCSSPQDFTRRLMLAYAESQNGAINILARQAGAELRVYDLGVKGLEAHSNIITHKFMPEGTHNFRRGRAMSIETVEAAIMFGAELVRDAALERGTPPDVPGGWVGGRLAAHTPIIGTGEVGMANTSPACACIMAATGSRDASLVGRGAGLSDEALRHKQQVILDALTLHSDSLTDPLNILSCVGGLDIAAMVGVFIGGAAYRVPVIVDGVISIAAALLAYQLEPLTRGYMLASHESLEPAYNHAAEAIGLAPSLRLGMRLGEGTGCAVFMQIIDDALAIINGMGTFDEL